MKLAWKPPKQGQVLAVLKQYRYVLLVAAAGILLLLWPTGGRQRQPVEEQGLTGAEEDFSVEALEQRLAQALSRIEGAGEVSVVLTVDSGMERVLATDQTQQQGEGELSSQEQTVILSTDEGEEVVLVAQRYPTFQGALVVCPGGDDPQLRLTLTQAVSGLTGLGSDRITVCAGS
ncbi:MAG TPA: stage III sporulation protein AG [Firmicutes bacterium]|nr:stage III sporulation protein AG [Bacillota bacterium]